jgi:hypothetical protein
MCAGRPKRARRQWLGAARRQALHEGHEAQRRCPHVNVRVVGTRCSDTETTQWTQSAPVHTCGSLRARGGRLGGLDEHAACGALHMALVGEHLVPGIVAAAASRRRQQGSAEAISSNTEASATCSKMAGPAS